MKNRHFCCAVLAGFGLLTLSDPCAWSNDAFTPEGRAEIETIEADRLFKAATGQEPSLGNVTSIVKDSHSASGITAAIGVLKSRYSSDPNYSKLINECIEKNPKSSNVLFAGADALYLIEPESGMRVWQSIVEQNDADLRYRILAVKKMFEFSDKYRADAVIAAGLLSGDELIRRQTVNLCKEYGDRIDQNVITEQIRSAKSVDEVKILDLLDNSLLNSPSSPKTK